MFEIFQKNFFLRNLTVKGNEGWRVAARRYARCREVFSLFILFCFKVLRAGGE